MLGRLSQFVMRSATYQLQPCACVPAVALFAKLGGGGRGGGLRELDGLRASV